MRFEPCGRGGRLNHDTELAALLDRSASKRKLRKEVITGFNTFVADQRSSVADAVALPVSLVQFDGQ